MVILRDNLNRSIVEVPIKLGCDDLVHIISMLEVDLDRNRLAVSRKQAI